MPVTVTGQLSSMYQFGAGIGVPLFLMIAGRFKRETLLKAMLGLNAVISLVMCLAHQFDVMLVVRFLMGFAGTCYGVLATATVSARAPSGEIGKYLSLLIGGSAVANIIGVPSIRMLSSFMGWRQIMMALVVLMAVILMYFIASLKAEESRGVQLKLKQELAFLKGREVLMVLLCSLTVFLGYGMQVYLTPYISQLFPSFTGMIGMILVFTGIASFLGNMLGGTVCDRIGYRKALMLGTGLQAVTALALLLTQFSGFMNVILIILWMGNAWFVGLQLNTGINVAVQNKSRFIISLNSSGIQLGSAIGAAIASFVIKNFDMGMIPATSMVTSILCCVITATNRKRV